jgi:esterase/lipase superfamily enzyme
MSSITYPGLVMTSVDVTYPDKRRNPKLVEFNGDDTNPKEYDTTALILKNLTGRNQGPFWNRKLIFSGEVVEPEEIVRGAKKPLIVIHGFNTSTKSHIKQCKEATEKFKNFNVIPVVWPSAGGVTNYWNDRKYSIAAGRALNSLKEFAGLFPHKSLLAHSMGNRVLREFADGDYKFDNIFMTAADVERRIFDKDYIDNDSKERHQDALRIRDMLSKDDKDSKIYVLHNSTDYALTGSTIVKLGRSRLGARGADFETMHPELQGKVENINCGTWLNGLSFASHTYHFADEAIKIIDSKFIGEDGDSTDKDNNANSDNIETFEDDMVPV